MPTSHDLGVPVSPRSAPVTRQIATVGVPAVLDAERVPYGQGRRSKCTARVPATVADGNGTATDYEWRFGLTPTGEDECRLMTSSIRNANEAGCHRIDGCALETPNAIRGRGSDVGVSNPDGTITSQYIIDFWKNCY